MAPWPGFAIVCIFSWNGWAHTKMLSDAVGASTIHRDSPILSYICKCPSNLVSPHVAQSRSTDKSSFSLTDISPSTSSGVRIITSYPQHYHCGGGLSSRFVDNAGQSISHCRKSFLVNKSPPISPSAIRRNDEGFHPLDQFIVGLSRLR